MQLLEQIKALEQAISQQSGERAELIGQLDKIAEDQTSASQNTETMVGKIQVRARYLLQTNGVKPHVATVLSIFYSDIPTIFLKLKMCFFRLTRLSREKCAASPCH